MLGRLFSSSTKDLNRIVLSIFYDKEIKAKTAFQLQGSIDKITKMPMDIRQVNWLAENIPGIGFILCIRDPRSILVSKVGDGRFKVNWNFCSHKIGMANIGTNEGLIERHGFMLRTLEYSPLICRYEELVNNPARMQEMIGERFGLHYDDDFEYFYKYDIPRAFKRRLNEARPVSVDRIESWKEYPERIIEQFTQCPELFDIIKYWGYEKNNNWFDKIKDEVVI
ncbi:hypothetical protein LCGC14_2846610 [marine sediment metagenome]|uniref:Sulfotransferase domain-containing protein n=1 Tax=marine sediment metagenome TaxID=412755 RepID=A0A0F9AI00_9ZZZZ